MHPRTVTLVWGGGSPDLKEQVHGEGGKSPSDAASTGGAWGIPWIWFSVHTPSLQRPLLFPSSFFFFLLWYNTRQIYHLKVNQPLSGI